MSGNQETETISEIVDRHLDELGVGKVTVFIAVASFVGANVVYEATESDYAAGFIVLLAAVIAFAFGVRTRAGFLDYNEKELQAANKLAEAWKKEAETIWSHISDESPVKRGSISNSMASAIAQRDNHTCTYCGIKGTPEKDPDGRAWHCDHVQPVSRGGLTNPSNLVLSCSRCNLSKGALNGAEYTRRKHAHRRRNRNQQ